VDFNEKFFPLVGSTRAEVQDIFVLVR